MSKLSGQRDVAPLEMEFIRLLHLEDSPEDAELVRNLLECGGVKCDATVVVGKDDFQMSLIQYEYDLIICDHGIPGYNGFAALHFAKQIQPQTPLIILSGSLNDEQAVESLKDGATDYVLKQKRARLVPAVRRALTEARERKRQAAAEEQIRQQARLRNLTHDAVVVRTMDGVVNFWNKGCETLFGWTGLEAVGQDFRSLLQADAAAIAAAREALLRTGGWTGELTLRTRSNEQVVVFSRWDLVRNHHGEPESILATNSDVTERRRLETIFLRAQRMDGVGALATGIAHDLNNALAPVLMSSEALKESIENPDHHRQLSIISAGALRASGIVKQILSFAQGAAPGMRPVSAGRIIRDMQKIIENTFPKSIAVSVEIAPTLWNFQGDETEFRQLLLNLEHQRAQRHADGRRAGHHRRERVG